MKKESHKMLLLKIYLSKRKLGKSYAFIISQPNFELDDDTYKNIAI